MDDQHVFALTPNRCDLEGTRPFRISREAYRFAARLVSHFTGLLPGDDMTRPTARQYVSTLKRSLETLKTLPRPKPGRFGQQTEEQRLVAYYKDRRNLDCVRRLVEWAEGPGKPGWVASLKWKRVIA
jgi:hypothetical protein